MDVLLEKSLKGSISDEVQKSRRDFAPNDVGIRIHVKIVRKDFRTIKGDAYGSMCKSCVSIGNCGIFLFLCLNGNCGVFSFLWGIGLDEDIRLSVISCKDICQQEKSCMRILSIFAAGRRVEVEGSMKILKIASRFERRLYSVLMTIPAISTRDGMLLNMLLEPAPVL